VKYASMLNGVINGAVGGAYLMVVGVVGVSSSTGRGGDTIRIRRFDGEVRRIA